MALLDNFFRFTFISYFVGLTVIKAVQADLRFLSPLPHFKSNLFYGDKVEFNCETNDPSAVTSLLSASSNSKFVETNLQPGKLVKSGDVFTLYNYGINDPHLYKCKAVDQKGNVIETPHSMFVLALRAKSPIYSHQPTQVQFRGVGESVKFVVIVKGVRPDKIRWRRIGENSQGFNITAEHNIKEIPNISNFSSILTLTNLQDNDDGIYQAVGTYRGVENNVFFVVQVYVPSKPWIYDITRDTVTNASEEAKLTCKAKGYPQADITWFFRDGTKIQGCYVERCDYEIWTDKRENKSESILTIKKVKYEDGGVYRCRAANEHGQNDSTTKLVVQTRPVIPDSSKIAYVNQKHGTKAKIHCKVSRSNPLPTIKWFYQDWPCKEDNLNGNCVPKTDQWRSLLPSSEVKIQHDGVFTSVITLSSESAAFYMCQAKNLLGNASKIFEFHRYTPTKKEFLGIQNGKSQFLKAGDTMVLQCLLKLGFIPLQSVRWFKDGVKLELGLNSNKTRTFYRIDDRLNSSQVLGAVPQARLTLIIANVSVKDSGTYTCKATENLNKTVAVTVKAIKPPQLIWRSKEITAMTVFENSSTSIQLPCVLKEGFPKPIFSWFRNGKELFLDKRQLTSPDCKHARDGIYLLSQGSEQVAVLCGDPLTYEKFTGRYTCRAVNEKGSYEIHADLNILASAEIVEPRKDDIQEIVSLGGPVKITCRARGNPPPGITWWKIQGANSILVKNGSANGSVSLIIKSVSEEDLGKYLCVAQNWHRDQHFVKLQLGTQASSGKPGSSGDTVLLVTVCLMVVVIAVIAVIFVRQRKALNMKRYYLGAERHHYEIDPDRTILEQVNDLPYDPDWEFREDRILLGTVIGSGAFGQVVKAEALGILYFNAREKTGEAFKRRSKIRRSIKARQIEQNPEDWKFAKTTVAVKMLKENAGESEYRDLASEIKIMIHIGEHPNIINILGACTRGKRLMLIMEYAPHGSMVNFLREKRLIYQPSWMKTVNDPNQEFTLVDVVMAAYQIARGMEFLASRKCIHRDLAARNVLIGDGYTMKIADFGLARDIYKSDEYVKQTNGLLPVKWMALESLFDRVYTEKSDVWSFGIVLWEIFTLGGTPYPSLPTEHLLDFLSHENRMRQPHNCPDEIYNMMRECWTTDPESRPPFAVLAEQLGQYLEENVRKDNPYITLALEETPTGVSNYYLRPADGIDFSTHNPSLEDLDPEGACGPLDFEPIHSPTTKTSNQFGKYDSPLRIIAPYNFEEEPGNDGAHAQYQNDLPGLRSSFNEAFLNDDCAFDLINDVEGRINEVEAWVRGARSSSRSSADEGIGLDDEGLERNKLLVRSAEESENREMIEMENRGKDCDKGKTLLMVDPQGSGTGTSC